MDEERRRDGETMEPDLEELAKRITDVETEAGEGVARALSKITELERKFAVLSDEFSRLSDAVNARR